MNLTNLARCSPYETEVLARSDSGHLVITARVEGVYVAVLIKRCSAKHVHALARQLQW